MKILTRLVLNLCICSREVSGSKTGRDTSYNAWSRKRFSLLPAGKCRNNPSIRLPPLLPNPLQLTIHHYPVIDTTEFGLLPASKNEVQRIKTTEPQTSL